MISCGAPRKAVEWFVFFSKRVVYGPHYSKRLISVQKFIYDKTLLLDKA